MNRPDEPLALSAPLARRMAVELCGRGSDECSWYHGLWQDLRAIGLAASPQHQAEFFLNAFHGISTKPGRQRVLISGAADYSILAYVLWACGENGVAAEVTVVDRCRTPLFLNTWYAARIGRSITTVCEDIFQYRPEMPFDVICSHSFLGQFPAERRPGLIEKWWHLLTPTGIVVAVNRVRPAAGAKEVRFSPEEARAFCATVAGRIGVSPAVSPLEREEILRRAEIYVERSQTYAISAEELASLFEQNGFRIENASSVLSTDPQNQNRDISGKAIPKDAKHACVVARKGEAQIPAA